MVSYAYWATRHVKRGQAHLPATFGYRMGMKLPSRLWNQGYPLACMSDLSLAEKIRLEELLAMEAGYVGGFTNRAFSDFVFGSVGANIYDDAYGRNGNSKANRLRSFFSEAPNHLVGRLLEDFYQNWSAVRSYDAPDEPPEDLARIARRLIDTSPASEIQEALNAVSGDDFELLASAVRDAVDKGQPAAALDRLHTYATILFRQVCESHGLKVVRSTPLDGLVGMYAKKLVAEGVLESDMTLKILKSSISVFAAYNKVRNEHSFAHANQLLNQDESQLIVSYVVSTLRFVRRVESALAADQDAAEPQRSDRNDV